MPDKPIFMLVPDPSQAYGFRVLKLASFNSFRVFPNGSLMNSIPVFIFKMVVWAYDAV
jgi:hypothetical protein